MNTFQVGNLVTFVDYAGTKLGGRVLRIEPHDVEVKVVGLSVPHPYRVGDTIWRSPEHIIDWPGRPSSLVHADGLVEFA